MEETGGKLPTSGDSNGSVTLNSVNVNGDVVTDVINENNDIGLVLEGLIDQIVAMETGSGNDLVSHGSGTLDKSLTSGANANDALKSQQWGLGVSQTGRIMDPICLQQNIFSSIAAENLVEYQWPAGTSGDYYMLQEQVSTFLNITSFKRKYPEIERRKVDPDEVNHLLGNHVISEVQVTLGLTALRSSDVCDMMMREYPEKYNEYNTVMQEREKQKMQNKYKQYVSSANVPVEKSQMTNCLKKAMKQVAEYNAHINRQRKEDFSVYYDMSTNVLQYPRSKVRKLDPSLTRPSLYPCALISGQFQEYHQKYTKNELMYFPLNTALYGPPQPRPSANDVESSDSESDSAVESDASGSSMPRSVKSTSSAKHKSKPASARSSVVGDTPMEVSEVDIPEDSLQSAESGSKQDDDEGPGRPVCGICGKDETSNKKGDEEDLIKCSQCDNHGHPTCLEMSEELVSVILTYNWQCMECKTCTICSMPHREDLMMFCDRCDRGYHTFCVSLRVIPSGVWACSRCTYADPDFIKRRRKQLRASQSPSGGGRGRGGKRRRQRRTENKQTIIIDMDETNLNTVAENSNGNSEGAPPSDSAVDQQNDDSNTSTSDVQTQQSEPTDNKVPIAVIKLAEGGNTVHSIVREATPRVAKPETPQPDTKGATTDSAD